MCSLLRPMHAWAQCGGAAVLLGPGLCRQVPRYGKLRYKRRIIVITIVHMSQAFHRHLLLGSRQAVNLRNAEGGGWTVQAADMGSGQSWACCSTLHVPCTPRLAASLACRAASCVRSCVQSNCMTNCPQLHWRQSKASPILSLVIKAFFPSYMDMCQSPLFVQRVKGQTTANPAHGSGPHPPGELP